MEYRIFPAFSFTDTEVFSVYRSSIFLHGRRLVKPAQATARLLGLSPQEIELLGRAALLHDLGKLAVPTAILCKADPLTAEEWRVIRNHAELGYRILLHAGGELAHLAPIVRAHHERWDGQGYPLGLAKEEIPLPARILAVVDSYDAMVSPRTYRRSFSAAEARVELQNCAGHQYDPLIVTAFLQIIDKQEYNTIFFDQGGMASVIEQPVFLRRVTDDYCLWSEATCIAPVAVSSIMTQWQEIQFLFQAGW